LLTRLFERQRRRGWLADEDLRAVAAEARAPLYRVQELVSFYPHFRRTPPPKVDVALCRDIACRLAGGPAHADNIRERLGTQPDVSIREVSCLGRCDHAPAALLDDAPASISESSEVCPLPPGSNLRTPARSDPYPTPEARYGVLRRLRQSDAAQAPQEVLDQLKASGLRGMGGAGFPTGAKWELVRKEQRTPKYVICNADESEPGTFKDRELLLRLPHLVIEGMCIAGLVVGAARGILFIRHEYEPEQHVFERALADARQRGVLGADFDIEVFTSPGGYILGEETALLEALEDRRGEPRNKPPFPGTHGLHAQPTLINNVETLAMVPAIVSKGADWWKAQGKPGFAGLKFMAVSGHVERPGVYEIAVGTTVRELIDLAGGVRDGKALLAFAPGGASSMWLPASAVDTPLDFTAVAKAGSMLGSGALIVVAEGTDMLDVAANVTRFFRNESCGKCVPCRLGTEHAVQILDRVQQGEARLDPAWLQAMGDTLQQTSICGLGQVALAPLQSVLKHWPDARARSASEG
jgi:NADH:ubiquinone oxidoreductase subunit F (NADH-binding)